MRVILILLFVVNAFMLSAQVSVKKDDSIGKEHKQAKASLNRTETQLNYFVIKSKGSTYGYSIYADGKLFIYQETIPGQPGAFGFKDTLSASKTAQLVIEKIKKGDSQPNISLEEMKMLNIDFER